LLLALNVGGAEVLAARLARRLRHQYRFVFACLDELGPLGRQLQDEGFLVEVVGRHPGVDWWCVRRLATLLQAQRADVVHAHQYSPFFYGSAARMLAGRASVVFTEHGRDFPDIRRPKRVWANRLVLLRRRDRVVGVGESVRQALVQNEGIPARRVETIYNGVDLSPYAGVPDLTDRAEARREMGLGDNDLGIIQVARLNFMKDHATAVRTMARLATGCPETRLILVGDGEERGSIEALVGQLGLGDRVQLLGTRNDVPRLVRAADLFLLTSVSEGIPLTVIEAMAAGLPVVSTDVGGLREVVEVGRTALLAPAGDDQALAGAILRLAGDPGRRAAMGAAGRLRAWARFSEDRMVDDYNRLYEELIHA
jgi:glycosyltransferase involved in cell wall biosynthesis